MSDENKKIGKFKGECKEGCKDCQPALCPNDLPRRRKFQTVFYDLNPPPAHDPEDYVSKK